MEVEIIINYYYCQVGIVVVPLSLYEYQSAAGEFLPGKARVTKSSELQQQ